MYKRIESRDYIWSRGRKEIGRVSETETEAEAEVEAEGKVGVVLSKY